MKNCEVCGTLNFKKDNYCTHCGCRIVEENICPYCGYKNADDSDVCIRCNRHITPISIDKFDDFFTNKNFQLLVNADLDVAEYSHILSNMFRKLDYTIITGNTSKEKVIQIASVFTQVIPKSSGVVFGEYGSPVIFYDDRLDDSLQTSTIIHELAHFIFFDLSVNILSKILEVKESSVINAFVEYFLTSPDIEIINEFYAHTVENRFIPLKFQGFESFISCVHGLGLELDDVEDLMYLGYSLAYDVISFLEEYIDNELRESIKLQFKIDMITPKKNMVYNLPNVMLPYNEKISSIIGLMAHYLYDLSNNKEAREELEYKRSKYND